MSYKKRAPSKDLAIPGDPLVTEHGEIIYEDSPADKVKQRTHNVNAFNFKSTKKRQLKDIPGPVSLINAVACIFMYTTLGVGDREIQDALKITSPEFDQIKKHSAYNECFEIIASEFINANSALLSSRIAAYSHAALTSVANIALNGKKEENILRASDSLLDRAGVSPKENASRGQQDNNTLRIVVIDGEKHVGIELNGSMVR